MTFKTEAALRLHVVEATPLSKKAIKQAQDNPTFKAIMAILKPWYKTAFNKYHLHWMDDKISQGHRLSEESDLCGEHDWVKMHTPEESGLVYIDSGSGEDADGNSVLDELKTKVAP